MKNIPRNTFNQGGDYWKLKTENICERIEDDTNKWEIFCAYGLEEWILIEGPYCPKQHTDEMQSLSKFQWHFSQNK